MVLNKSAIALIIAAVLFSGLTTNAMEGENNTGAHDANVIIDKIGELEKTVKMQEEQIHRTEKALDGLKKQLDAQVKENNKLQELCKKAGIDITKEINSDSTPSQSIVYRGQERDKDWFERMYKIFYDKIAFADDKYIDLRTFKPKFLSGNFTEVGTTVIARSALGGRVFSKNEVYNVIGDGEALIRFGEYENLGSATSKFNPNFQSIDALKNRPGTPIRELGTGIIYHLCGYERPLISGADLEIKNLICVGTYNYIDASGVPKTVQSFKVWEPEPLTKDQFAEALRSGFELVNYVEKQGKMVKVPIR